MSDKFSLGKNSKFGEIDFSKLRSGITKEDLGIVNDNVLGSIFDSVNTNNNGDSANKLDRNELNAFIKIIKELCGKDNNLSSSEAKKYKINDDKLGKDKESLLTFLQKLSNISTKENIHKVEQNTDKKSEIITYDDGHTEEIFQDGSKIITVKNGNKTTTTKKDKSGNITEETITEGENKTTRKEYKNGKLSKEIITDTDADTVETIIYDANGEPKSKEIKRGNNIVEDYKYENSRFVLKEKADIENNTVTTYSDNKAITVTEKDGVKTTEIKENNVLKSKKEEKKLDNDQTQVTITTYDDENNWTSETVTGDSLTSQTKSVNGNKYTVNYVPIDTKINPDGVGVKVIVQNGESLSMLAKRFNCSMQDIVTLNAKYIKGTHPNQYFYVGQEIIVPGKLDPDYQYLQNRKDSKGAEADYKDFINKRDAAIAEKEAELQAKSDAAAAAQAAAAAEEAKAEIRKEAKTIAEGLKASMEGLFTKSTDYREQMKKIDAMNVLEVLDEFNKISPDETLVEWIMNEIGQEFLTRRKDVETIATALRIRAELAGIDEYEIKDFADNVTKELNILERKIGKADRKPLANLISSFAAKIEFAETRKETNQDANISANPGDKATAEEAGKVIEDIQLTLNEVDNAYKNGTASIGWTGDVSDFISRLWSSENRAEVVEAEIEEYKANVERLKKAANNELTDESGKSLSFNDVFYEIYGVEYNENYYNAYQEAKDKFTLASIAVANQEIMNDYFAEIIKIAESENYDAAELLSRFENAFNNFGKTVDFSNVNFNDTEKIEFFIDAAKSLIGDANNVVNQYLSEGETLSDLKRKQDNLYKVTFGYDNDLMQRVEEYIQSQQMGSSITKGLTVAAAIAIAVGTLGTGSTVSAAMIGAVTTVGASAVVEISDRLTNELDNAQDLSSREVFGILKNAAIDGGIYAVTLGLTKLVPGANPSQILSVAKQIVLESTIDGGVSIAGDYIKTGEVTKEGVAYNMLIALVADASPTLMETFRKTDIDVSSPDVKAQNADSSTKNQIDNNVPDDVNSSVKVQSKIVELNNEIAKLDEQIKNLEEKIKNTPKKGKDVDKVVKMRKKLETLNSTRAEKYRELIKLKDEIADLSGKVVDEVVNVEIDIEDNVTDNIEIKEPTTSDITNVDDVATGIVNTQETITTSNDLTPDNKPTQEYNSKNQKIIELENNKSIIDPSEYPNLSDQELYDEYKLLTKYKNDLSNPALDNNIKNIEDILENRGLKIGQNGLESNTTISNKDPDTDTNADSDTKSVDNDSESLEIEVRPIDEDSDVIEYFDDTPTDMQKKLRDDIRKDIEEKFWADAENLKRTLGEDFYNKLAWENIIQENATPEEIKNILQDLNNKAKNFSKLDGIAKKYGKDFEWADKVVTMQNDAVNKIISGASFDEVINGLAADYRNIDLSLQKDSHRMLHSGQYRPDYCPNASPYTPCLQGGRYGAYYERFKNMIDSNNALSPLFENAPMTRLEYDATNGRVIMQHPAADNIPLAMNHVEKIHNNLQELVNKVKSSQQLSPTEQVFIDESIAEIHYTLSHAMPWARGSNGIIDSYVRSLYKSLGLDLPALKNNVSLDLEAFCTDLETFKNKWCYQEFFEQTVVDLETKLNVNSSVVDHPVIPSSKYELDELGFIKTSEYSKLSNDELIEEYTKLKAYEDDGKNIVLNNSNRNSDDCQVVVNTHSRYTERDAIKTELDKRGLKLERMNVDGKTVYSYSKKQIATDAPSNTPTADVDVKYNEVGRKMTKGYGNKDIIDPSEYNNLTNYELYSEYKKLNTDRINGSILHAYKDWERYSHDYTNYLKQIEDILHKRGYKIGDKGPVEIEMNILERIKTRRARKKERKAEQNRVEEFSSALDNYHSKLKEQKQALMNAVYYEGGTNLPKDGLKIEDISIGAYHGGYKTLVGHKQHAEFEPIDPRMALIQDNRYSEYMSKDGCVDCYYSKDANATQIVFRGVDGGRGSWNITVKGQVSLGDGANLVKHLQDKNLIYYDWINNGYVAVGRKASLTNYEREAIGKNIQKEIFNFFQNL